MGMSKETKMIKFQPLGKHNFDYSLQPNFYLHGTISEKYDTDCVTMLDDVFNERISAFYYRGEALPAKYINIPEGIHACEVNGVFCTLFTWKNLFATKKGWVGASGYNGPYDIWLKQSGLIVDIRDKEGLADARDKFNKRINII